MACQENHFLNQITELYVRQISKLKSLKPTKEADTLFGQLMTLCLPTDMNIDVTKMSQEVQDIRSNLIELRGEAVGYLEQQENPLNQLPVPDPKILFIRVKI